MDIPAAAASHLPVLVASPDLMPSNGVSMMVCSTPSLAATRSTMSTSNPTILPPCADWNGSNGRVVQTVSLPGSMSVALAASMSAWVTSAAAELPAAEDSLPAADEPGGASDEEAAAVVAADDGALEGVVLSLLPQAASASMPPKVKASTDARRRRVVG